MKVIAKTESGYLVEATSAELANIAGEQHLSHTDFVKSEPSGYGRSWKIPIGTTINVTERFQHLVKLETARDAVLSNASALKGFAAILEKAVPAALVIPEPEFEEVPEVGSNG